MKRFFWVWRRLCWDWLGRRVLRGLWDCWGVSWGPLGINWWLWDISMDNLYISSTYKWLTTGYGHIMDNHWLWWTMMAILDEHFGCFFFRFFSSAPDASDPSNSSNRSQRGFSHGFVGPLGPSMGFQQEKSVFRPALNTKIQHWVTGKAILSSSPSLQCHEARWGGCNHKWCRIGDAKYNFRGKRSKNCLC